MNMKPRSLLATVVALSLAIPGLAAADRRGGDYRAHGDRHEYRSAYRERHHDRHDRHDYRDSHVTTRYYSHDDDDGEKLLLGLVVGGILGYAINGAQHANTYDYSDRYSPRTQTEAYPAQGGAYGYEASAGTCLQEREYQTTVVVGGKNVPAYGTACLQPDGSWKREPAQLVSY